MFEKKKGKEMTGCLKPFKLAFIKEICFFLLVRKKNHCVILSDTLHFKGLSISSLYFSKEKCYGTAFFNHHSTIAIEIHLQI